MIAPATPMVSVSPRHRVRSQADVVRLLGALMLIGIGVLAATWARNTLGGAEEDLVEVYQRVPDHFAEALTGLAVAGTVVVPMGVLIVLFARQRYRQVGTLLIGALGAGFGMRWLTEILAAQDMIAVDPSTERVVEFTNPAFATSPLIASAVALVVISSTWLSQQWQRALWAGVGVLMVFRVVSSSEPPLDIVVAFAVGMAAGSLALLLFGTESFDPAAPELLSLMASVGPVSRIVQRDSQSPLTYDIDLENGDQLRMRLRTAHDRSADVLEQLWRALRLRTWLTNRPYDTVQRRMEHEALAQSAAAAAGVTVAPVRRVLASSQGSVALLEDRIDATVATELSLDRELLIEVWRQVQAMHRDRIAHRSLGLADVLVTTDGQVMLRNFDAARLAAPERDLAIDRAQLLVSSALAVGPAAAIDAAIEVIGSDAVASAVPFIQPLALPSTTRRTWRKDRRVKEALDALRDAIRDVTDVAPAPLARLDRVRPRTIVSVVALTAGFYYLLPQLLRAETAEAVAAANWWWIAPIVAGAVINIASAALALIASVPEPISYLPAFRMQFAASFVGRIAPANTGSLAVGVRFLQRSGLDSGAAAAGVGLTALVGVLVHLSLMAGFLVWTGSRGVSFKLPVTGTLFIVFGVLLLASVLVVGLVPALRRRIIPPLVQQARTAISALGDVLTDPIRVLTLIGGSFGVTGSFILTLAASVAAFGGGVSFPEIGAAYLVAFAIGTAAPTPGGLGAIETALTLALTGYGMANGPAVSAVLVFRLATYWLPMIPGWFMFQQMQKREEL